MSGNTGRRRQARFEAIALPHLDAAYALARRLTHNDADAADVVQEVFLRAFRYFHSCRGDDAKSWVLKIVRRTCYSWLERNRPADVVSLEAEEELGNAVATSAIDTELLESRSNLRPLDRLIAALPVPLRAARAARARLSRNRRGNRHTDGPTEERPVECAANSPMFSAMLRGITNRRPRISPSNRSSRIGPTLLLLRWRARTNFVPAAHLR
jgi:RNA polymerase sigma factor (sigma-70 family)